MHRLIILLSFLLLTIKGYPQDNILNQYIKDGLESNLALKQKQLSYNKSIAALEEAKGLFYPNLSINARYTVADGGRIIDFPIGDMLNPIHQGLNQILVTQGYPASYPTDVQNESFTFYRSKEHDTKLSLIQPLFIPEIHYNYKIKKELITTKDIELIMYKRQLVAEIKKAYYNYLKTIQLIYLLDETQKLLKENIRVSESLFKNNVRTIDVVYRSKAELSKFEQQRSEVIKQNQLASAYFNFLLNKPLESEIIVDEEIKLLPQKSGLDEAKNMALQNREELKQLNSYINVTDQNIKLNQGSRYPTLLGAVDYGYQGTEYRFTNEDDYVLASLVLTWNLFEGFQNKARIQQAIIERSIIDTKVEEVRKQINLEVINAYYDLEATIKAIVAAEDQRKSSKKAFEIINKKYKEGQANLIQFIDARTTMTNAEQNLILTKYDYKVKYAEYERIVASTPIVEPNTNNE
jgi:outer membrane protein TolC